MTYIFVIILSSLVGYLGLYIFRKLGYLDKPGSDVPPRNPVPTLQGIPLYIGFILILAVLFPEYLLPIKGFLIGSFMIVFIAFLDEIKRFDNFGSVSPKVRLLVQILAACSVFFLGGIGLNSVSLPYFGEIQIPLILGLGFTIIWFVGFMNAINWFDGVTGMASGISSIGFLTIFILIQYVVFGTFTDISPERIEILHMVKNLSFILFILSGIYCFIEYKPLGVLRDVGVMFLGFSLGYLSLLGGAKIGIILVVLSLPIFDSIWVFVNRLFVKKKNPMKGDLSHIHHRLLAMRWSRGEIRFFIRGWSIFLMVLMLLQGVNRFNKMIIFILLFVIFFGINIYLFWIKKMPMEFKPKYK